MKQEGEDMREGEMHTESHHAIGPHVGKLQ